MTRLPQSIRAATLMGCTRTSRSTTPIAMGDWALSPNWEASSSTLTNEDMVNASKAYVSQAEMGYKYEDLQPVYSLNLVNDIFEKDIPEYIHNYRIVYDKYTRKVIEGLCFTFIELPKFQPHTMNEKRMTILWLRFLTEINDKTQTAPKELLDNPEVSKALEEVKVSAFTEEELRAYNKFWDIVSSERTLLSGSYQEGAQDEKEKIARNLLALHVLLNTIAKATGLREEEMERLK